MYVIYGKGKTGNGLRVLIQQLGIESIMMDDSDADQEILRKTQKIIVSPGIPHTNSIYGKYKEKIQSELNFVGSVLDDLKIKENIEFIGVTGTNGKSTSVWILYNIFKNLKLDSHIRLSGNFDIPLSQTLFEILDKKLEHEKHVIILECSSFMLKTLKNIQFEYSIWLNFAVDHLNWHDDMQDYFESKNNIIKLTKKTIFVNHLLKNGNIERWKDEGVVSKIEVFDEGYDLKNTKFLGQYNAGNINACYLLVKRYLTSPPTPLLNAPFYSAKRGELGDLDFMLKSMISQIEPLPHHMILVKTIDGVNIYDDAKSKSSLSITRALECFDEQVVLIAGGYNKGGDDYTKLGGIFAEKVVFATLIGQTAPIFSEVMKGKNIENKIFPDLKSAFDEALDYAKKNQIKNLLFSPGCASYDMFKNFEERAEVFISLVGGI